jgi:hypothetical protein
MPGISYNIKIDINGSQVVKHFFYYNETSLRVFVISGLQVLLSIATCIIKQVKHFVLLVLIMVNIGSEFALDLKLLIEER